MGGPPQRNVVWITVDSVRADRTTMCGYHRDTTPNLARIAADQDGDWFDTCIAQTRWTPASTASILTGTYLSTHGVGIESPEVRTLPESLRTLPELLSAVGYTSLGIGTNQYVCSATDMDRGFDRFMFPTVKNLHRTVGVGAIFDYVRNLSRYGDFTTDRTRHSISSMVTHAAKRWAGSNATADSPVFLYIHYNETHYPYSPPRHFLEPYASEIDQSVKEILDRSKAILQDVFGHVADGLALDSADMAAIEAAYDAGLKYHDHLIGELFDYVQATLPGETIFVVTGDHGETFGEHGWLGHHVLMTDELLHVPMVTHGLETVSSEPGRPVQHLDFTRTIAERIGAGHQQFEGINLAAEEREFAIAQRASRESDREKLLRHNSDFDTDRYRWDAINCIHDGRFKYVTGEAGDQLFVVPDESTDRIEDYPRVAETLATELAARRPEFAISDAEAAERAEFDDEMRARLEHMGYL